MFRRLLGLFRRYSRQHRYIEVPGFSFGAYSDTRTKRLDPARLTDSDARAVFAAGVSEQALFDAITGVGGGWQSALLVPLLARHLMQQQRQLHSYACHY